MALIEIQLVLLLQEGVFVLVFVLAILNVHESLKNNLSVVKHYEFGLALGGVLPGECNFRICTVYQSKLLSLVAAFYTKFCRIFLTHILFEVPEEGGSLTGC